MKTLRSSCFFFLFCVLSWYSTKASAQTSANDMFAHFIDVGQGQAILLEFPAGAVLIDAGAQPDHENLLIQYLQRFFARRTDLHNTLNGIIITHQHVDHNIGLQDVVNTFKVLNYVDNGTRVVTAFEHNQIWMQDNVAAKGIKYENFTFEKITANHNLNGLSDAVVDPVGGTVPPKIILYSGAFQNNPAHWSADAFGNANNHSLVIKVIYGNASFLFSGDLQEEGIQQVLSYYHNTNVLDADVMQVGHHGAKNACDSLWVTAITPKYAVISCGYWKYGKKPDGSVKPLTTYAYAHPNEEIIKLIERHITATRVPTTDTVGITGSFHGSIPKFEPMTITQAVYATPWDGNIVIEASPQGNYQILTHQ